MTTISTILRACFATGLLVSLAQSAGAAVSAAEPTDLRDIRVGMAVSELPSSGYVHFTCADAGKTSLSGWDGWKSCPVDSDGLHGVHFQYDPATSREGTIVAGHPAILTLLVDDSGTVAGLEIDTDPTARLYLRKKAFLLGMQAKSRYGQQGWTCEHGKPSAQEEPVGGVFLKEHCTKTASGRAVSIDRNLYRRANQDMKHFVSETRIRILSAAKPSPGK